MSSIHLQISVPYNEFQVHIKKAYAKASSRLNIAGFRKGKIPEQMIDLRIGRNQILNDAISTAIPDFFGKALVEKSLFVIGNPSFRVNTYKDGERLEFETQISVRPAIDLPDFSGIEIQVPSFQISDSDVDSNLASVLSSFDEKNASGIEPENIQERMNDDFVRSYSNFTSLEDLKSKIYQGLQVEKLIQQGSLARDLLITKLLNELEIPLPEDLIEKEVMDHLSREPEHDSEDHRIEVENEIRLSLKTDYLLDVISRANRIEINDAEINDYLVKAAQRFAISPQDLMTQLEKAGQIQPLMAEVARSKALAFALSQVLIVDSDGQVIRL